VIGILALPGLTLVDGPLLGFFRSWPWPLVTDFMQAVTWLGDGMVDTGIFLAVALVGWWRADRGLWTRGLVGAATVAGAGILDQILKNILCRARPNAAEAGAFFVNFPCFPARYAYASFPSGHATTAFAAALLLSLWYPRWAGVFVGLAVLVGLSRMVLGSHFPSDIVAGALLGGGVALVVHAYVPAARRAEAAVRADGV
jgi:undecaprenyl-diphosphatase